MAQCASLIAPYASDERLIQRRLPTCVTRGLDPRVHLFSQERFREEDGLPGQARQ
jgi:hypothetical protein